MAYADYYKEFPYNTILRLMAPVPLYNEACPGDIHAIGRRELAFSYSITKNGKVGTAFQRYQSLKTGGEVSLVVQLSRKLVNGRPIKIEIGPVYSLEPHITRKCHSRVEWRELIFDLDITPEYNGFRACPCTADPPPSFLCKLCWPFIAAGVHCLDYLLRIHFGYDDLLWTFSGRRGIHCQVLDPQAAVMSADARRTVSEFFERLWKADQQNSKGIFLDPRKPYLSHLYNSILLPRFERLVETTALNLSCNKALTVIANCFSSPRESQRIKLFLDDVAQNPRSSSDVWVQLSALATQLTCKDHLPKIVYSILFPKLDLGVTKAANHLLRCPMSIHHETEGIAVPLILEDIDSVDVVRLPCLRRRETLVNLKRYMADFELCLQSRLAFANFLVCMHCAESVQDLKKLPDNIVFMTNKFEWKEHQRQMHPTSLYTADISTLRMLIGRRSRREDGTQDWPLKVECYKTLNKKFG